ncbi:MAG: hypothetical protein H0Z34_09500 [Brevibacillus sp.]|nr:hypothetical protein [Brevibacillus sp.]
MAPGIRQAKKADDHFIYKDKGSGENGNITIFALFLLMAAISGTLYLAYYYSGFVSIRQAQNAADSAALAAGQELRDQFVTKMKQKTMETMHHFKRKIRDEAEACEASRNENSPPCPTETDLIKLYIKDPELKHLLIANRYHNPEHWLLVVNEEHFRQDYTKEQNGDVLYDAFVQSQRAIQTAARKAAAKNGGERQMTIRFPVDGLPTVEVISVKTMSHSRLDDSDPARIRARAAAGVDAPFDVDVSNKISKTLRVNWPPP